MISRLINGLYHSSAADVVQYVKSWRGRVDSSALERVLAQRFSHFRAEQLVGIDRQVFREHLLSAIDVVDADVEGYRTQELSRQRDLSVKFHWGHDHDFGDFSVAGRMKDRHLQVTADFVANFPIDLEDFRDQDVLDIGCWTGGTTLLLAALGARVHALEEVEKYAQMAAFLCSSFGVPATVEGRSVYQCNAAEFHERFDIVFFPGVLYHLSDPVLALRILFNTLRPGGVILLESAGIPSARSLCRFDGSRLFHSGSREALNRGGWNWFLPSPRALQRMMDEAGFAQINTYWDRRRRRVYGFGRKQGAAPICRAGLSVPDIP